MVNNPILVTGATGGIGKAVINKLLSQNYYVIAISQNYESLESKYKNVSNCSFICYDLNDLDGIPTLVKNIVKEYGAIRGLVHCAGIDKLSPLYLTKIDDIKNMFSIHVYSTISLCSQLIKKGNASDKCSIVLISSLAAHEGAQCHSVYAAAKGAIEGFLPSAASEFSEKGIRLNVVVPGIVMTQMSADYISKMDEKQKANLQNSYPLGFGNPSDVADTICYLIGDESKWITGQKFILDGGHMCRKV